MLTGPEVVAAAPYLKMLAPAVLSALKESLGWSVEKVKEVFNSTFREHLEVTKRRSSYVKIISNPDRPTKLEDIYVNLYLNSGGIRYRDEDIIAFVDDTSHVLVSGTAGAGKSMLMRFLVLKALDPEYPQVPLFVELRDIKNPKDVPFLESIFLLSTPEEQRANRAIFDKAVLHDGFCLFLDGLDEVSPEFRDELKSQIDDVTVRYPRMKIVVSSRPDIDFSSWRQFNILHIEPIDRWQSASIIRKASYDDEIKQVFLKKLEDGSFDKYESFLSVPLLNVILLMCFGEFLELSERASTFYDQAFDVLYRRHDRSKGLKRKHFSSLSEEQFRTLLYTFCYRSISDMFTNFTEEELSSYITKSAKFSEIQVDATAFSQDLTESVSLMHRDGLKIHFIHRSFQEYFAAKFIANYSGPEMFRVYDVAMRSGLGNLLSTMAAEIDPRKLEREWTLPVLSEMLKVLVRSDGNLDLPVLIQHFSISHSDGIFKTSGYGWNSESQNGRLQALATVYPEELKKCQMPLGMDEVIYKGQPLAFEASNPNSSLAPSFINFIKDAVSNGLDSQFQFDFKSEDWRWIEYTQLPGLWEMMITELKALHLNVGSRVEERSRMSIFQ